jgi:hypothetical protein
MEIALSKHQWLILQSRLDRVENSHEISAKELHKVSSVNPLKPPLHLLLSHILTFSGLLVDRDHCGRRSDERGLEQVHVGGGKH